MIQPGSPSDAGGRADVSKVDLPSLRGLSDYSRRVEEAWTLLMGSVRDHGIFLIDPSGRISSWNQGAEQIFGYPAPEILGQPGHVLFTPEDRELGLPADELRRAREQGRAVDENWLFAKGGRRFWGSGTTWPLHDAAGELVGYAKVVRDLTEQRQQNEELEERVRERTADLEASLTELETFAYTVAHDLRAPLRAMAGFGEALLSEYRDKPLDALGQEYVTRSVEAARRMDALIQDLLAYSKLTREEVELEPLNLEHVAARVVDRMKDEIEKSGGTVEIVTPMPETYAHRSSLEQALSNLISNGLKFVPPGVRPRVRVRAETLPSGVRLWVEDFGIGIDPKHQEVIFGLFQRLHPQEGPYSGTGIGLAIVRRAMERMEGSAGVESAPGKGSRFFLQLPKSPEHGRRTRRHRGARGRAER